jgi:hypothetical protein
MKKKCVNEDKEFMAYNIPGFYDLEWHAAFD